MADSSNHRVRKLVPNTPAQFEIVGGNNQLSGVATLSTTTTTNGVAGIGVTLGNTAGSVTISAAVGVLAPVRFTLTAKETPGGVTTPAPRIAENGVVGAGLSVPPITQISPNGIITIYGDNFAPASTQRLVAPEELVNGRLPTRLGGVCVLFGSERAPIFHVFPGQLNIQVPSVSAGADVSVQVITNCGEANETKNNIRTVAVRAATPEFFYFVRNPDGKNPVAALNAVTGERIGAPGLIAGVPFTPAKPGDVLTIYGTGFGVTSPVFAPGELPDRAGPTVEKARVSLGLLDLAGSDVLHCGVAPFLAGVHQLNIRVPANLPDGDYPLMLRLGNAATPSGGLLTIRR